MSFITRIIEDRAAMLEAEGLTEKAEDMRQAARDHQAESDRTRASFEELERMPDAPPDRDPRSRVRQRKGMRAKEIGDVWQGGA